MAYLSACLPNDALPGVQFMWKRTEVRLRTGNLCWSDCCQEGGLRKEERGTLGREFNSSNGSVRKQSSPDVLRGFRGFPHAKAGIKSGLGQNSFLWNHFPFTSHLPSDSRQGTVVNCYRVDTETVVKCHSLHAGTVVKCYTVPTPKLLLNAIVLNRNCRYILQSQDRNRR
jgi:hypothetical protein